MDGKLKMLLKSVTLKKGPKTSNYDDKTFMVICKIRADEWRSKGSDNAGLSQEFSF